MTYGGSVASQNEEFTVPEYHHLRALTRSLSGLVASTCVDDREQQCRVKLDREQVGAHFVSRTLRQLGHEPRIIPEIYVKPFAKGQKNDYNDAEANRRSRIAA